MPWSLTRILYNMLNLLTGWLLLYFIIWWLISHPYRDTEQPDSSVRFRSNTALICTSLAFVFLLLFIVLPGEAWKAEALVSIAVTVGFAWRRAYGISVDVITARYAEHINPSDPYRGEMALEILLAIPLLALLMPMQYLS